MSYRIFRERILFTCLCANYKRKFETWEKRKNFFLCKIRISWDACEKCILILLLWYLVWFLCIGCTALVSILLVRNSVKEIYVNIMPILWARAMWTNEFCKFYAISNSIAHWHHCCVHALIASCLHSSGICKSFLPKSVISWSKSTQPFWISCACLAKDTVICCLLFIIYYLLSWFCIHFDRLQFSEATNMCKWWKKKWNHKRDFFYLHNLFQHSITLSGRKRRRRKKTVGK